MRKRFSERYGYKQVRESLQLNWIDEALKNRLWNTFKHFYIDSIVLDFGKIKHTNNYNFFKRLYDEFFKTHERPKLHMMSLEKEIFHNFFLLKWYEIYDFIEYLSSCYHDLKINDAFKIKINQVLEDEMSGYRFVGEYIAPIIDEVEIQEVEQAMDCQYEGVKRHLSNALEHLSDRTNPDFINSIKESISSVESLLNILAGTNNNPLNKAIQKLPFEIDKNFGTALIRLYSWTSSADGIRHGETGEEIKSSFEEAKYMLVICSSFVNYLIAKAK
jgi:hypothetical protein